MDLVNRSSVFTLSTAFITPMLTLLHPAKWPLGPTLSFPFVKQLSHLFPSHFAHLSNSYPAFTPYQGFPPVISEAAYFLEQPLVFIQVSTQPNTIYGSPLSTSFLKYFQNCSRMLGQDSLPTTTPQELWEHDNFSVQEYSENLFFVMKSTILQGKEVRFTDSSSPWALLQSLGLLGRTLPVLIPVIRHKGTL